MTNYDLEQGARHIGTLSLAEGVEIVKRQADTGASDPPSTPPGDNTPPEPTPAEPTPTDDGASAPGAKPPHAVGVEISGPKQLTVGEIGHYHARFLMSDGSKEPPHGVRWVPHNRRVLDFPADGNNWSGQYQGKSPGRAKVIYSGGGQRGEYPVTVVAADESGDGADDGEGTTTPAPDEPPTNPPPAQGGPVTAPDPGHVSGGTTPGCVHAVMALDNGDGSTSLLEDDFAPGRTRFKAADGSAHWLAVRHGNDGCARIENGYINTPGMYTGEISLYAPDGAALIEQTQARVLPYAAHTNYWYQQPSPKPVDAELLKFLPHYAPGVPDSFYDADKLKRWRGINSIGPADSYMGAQGEREDLGLNPAWYVPAILDPSDDNAAVVRAIADTIGNWQFLVLDPDTDAPVRLDNPKWAKASLTQPGKYGNPIKTGCWVPGGNHTDPYREDEAHMPALAIIPALLFGTEYDREMLDVMANYAGVSRNFNYRGRDKVRIDSGQVRMQAWALRDVAAAAAILDSDYYKKWLNNTADHLEHVHEDYQIPGIPLLRTHTSPYQNQTACAPWQQDYWMSAVAYAARLGFSRYTRMGQYFGQLQVQRMLDAPHEYATSYEARYRESRHAAFVADWAAAMRLSRSAQMLALAEDSIELAHALEPNHIGQYLAGDFDGYPWSPTGYAAIMQPALAAAVDLGVPRAREAWDKYTQYARQSWAKDWKYNIVPVNA